MHSHPETPHPYPDADDNSPPPYNSPGFACASNPSPLPPQAGTVGRCWPVVVVVVVVRA